MNICFIGCFFVRNFASSNKNKRLTVIFEATPRKSAAPQQSLKASFRICIRFARSLTYWNKQNYFHHRLRR